MKDKQRILFISYDGLTDPLGRSQIIPYMVGLSFAGYEISILSCEKKASYIEKSELVKQILHLSNIRWKKVWYTKKPAVLSTLFDLWKMRRKAGAMHRKQNFAIVHCRTLLSMLIGFEIKTDKTKLIYDTRGFWIQERLDGKLWNTEKFIYRKVYKFFNKMETKALDTSDYIVCLTREAKKHLRSKVTAKRSSQIAVIPCSVDLNFFNPEKFNPGDIIREKKKLGIAKDSFVLGYIGSLGTRYLLEEMLDFFCFLKKEKPTAKFIFATNSPVMELESIAAKMGISSSIVVTSIDFTQVPLYISLFDISIYFIHPALSGIAVSPTKQAEILSMGKAIISNRGIGDSDELIEKNECGLLLKDFSESSFKECIQKLPEILKKDPRHFRKIARDNLSLEMAVEKYKNVYRELSEV